MKKKKMTKAQLDKKFSWTMDDIKVTRATSAQKS